MNVDTFLNKLPSTIKEKYTVYDQKNGCSIYLNHLIGFIEINHKEYFPEWTDHGMSHLLNVIENAVKLMSQEVIQSLTEQDVFCFLLSILLHDIAMMFNQDAFLEALEKSTILQRKWKKFVEEVQHWEEDEVKSSFGDEAEIPETEDLRSYTNSHKMIAGEFLRRHHGLIAKLVVDTKFQLIEGKTEISSHFEKQSEDFQRVCDIAGHVAMSHTRSMRDAYGKFLDDRGYGKTDILSKRPDGVHVVLLMALLRVADYLEFRNFTSQHFFYSYRCFSSPISLIENATMSAFDPIDWSRVSKGIITLIYHTVNPKINEYIESYYNGIQTEIDVSNALLSEVYPTDEGNNQRISIQVKSVLKENSLGKKFETEYFNKPLELTVNKAHVIFLLASPLYGYDPTYAIREALSNAHDAVSHRWSTSEPKTEGGAEIKLEFIQEEQFDGEGNLVDRVESIRFTDTGCGMSIWELKEYFLKIGGRMRDSLNFKTEYVKSKSGESYPFTSRFGIGVVALFMLGEKVDIVSKKGGEQGVSTSVEPHASSFVARKSKREVVGTEVVVSKLSANLIDDIRDQTNSLLTHGARTHRAAYVRFAVELVRFFPSVVPIRIIFKGRDPLEFTIPPLDELLSDVAVHNRKLKINNFSVEIEVRFARLGGDIDSWTIVYNGIPVEIERPAKVTWFFDHVVVFVSDPANKITFDLPKKNIRGISMQDLMSTLLDDFKGYTKEIEVKNDILSALFHKRSRPDFWVWNYRALARFREESVLVPLFFTIEGRLVSINSASSVNAFPDYTLIVCAHKELLRQIHGLKSGLLIVPLLRFDEKEDADTYHSDFAFPSVEVLSLSTPSRARTVRAKTQAELAAELVPFFGLEVKTDPILKFLISCYDRNENGKPLLESVYILSSEKAKTLFRAYTLDHGSMVQAIERKRRQT